MNRLYALAWLPYLALYVLVFRTQGIAWHQAVPGAIANALPEAVFGVVPLGLGMRAAARRKDGMRWHLVAGGLFAIAAVSGKVLLLSAFRAVEKHGFHPLPVARTALVDLLLVVQQSLGGATVRKVYDPAVAAWQFLLALLVYAILAAVGHAVGARDVLRREEARAARAETLYARAQLQALRAQLDPHFLFNTLHSLVALVRIDPERAERALEQFGDLMRYSTRVHREGVDEVRLAQEWRFVETYLEVERLRLGDRLRVILHADPDLLELSVPAFCLQPLVENAVIHAAAPRAGGATVSVRAVREGRHILLEVRDDGEGAATSGSAHGDTPSRRDAAAPGRGLRLVRERLRALHGTDSSLEAGPLDGGGFRAVARIPLPEPGGSP